MMEEVIFQIFDSNDIVWDLKGTFYSELNEKMYCFTVCFLHAKEYPVFISCFFSIVKIVFSCYLYMG